MPDGQTGDFLTHDRPAKTDLYCHNCSKNFVALLDYTVTGMHRIVCPHCSHIHFRKIEAGKVTGERWDSDHGSTDTSYPAMRVWKSDVIYAETTSAAHFMRQRWLDKLG